MRYTTPAADIRLAIETIEASIGQMRKAGIKCDGLDYLETCVDHLEGAFTELPDEVANADTVFCGDCVHCHTEVSFEPYGDTEVAHSTIECMAPNATDCPAVRACGFIDESDPVQVVPEFLRRQAE